MEINKIVFSYDKRTDNLKGADGLIEEKKVTTIIGPNGCGKSTLLGVMSGLYKPSAGQAVLDGKAIHHYKPRELAHKLAVVHQQNSAPADITVERLVGYGRMPYRGWFESNGEEDEQAIEWALTCTDLHKKREVRIDRLSGGERQRVWLAMALAQRTSMLFLDEPTTYLDMYYQLELLELVRRLNADFGLTIVMVLHDINQAIRYSDQIIAMKDGMIISRGAPRDVISAATVKAIYGVDVKVRDEPETGLYIVPTGI
ncbi:ABC transporter ATP-binding protein [Paenibacillaceae bacterium]|nr:ABC transporter ATP-binding protein [Paenibacillaceae bacterium]